MAIGRYYPKVKQHATATTGSNVLAMATGYSGHVELADCCPTGAVSNLNAWITTTGGEWWYGRCEYNPTTNKLTYDNSFNSSTGWATLASGDAVTVSVAPIPDNTKVLVFLGSRQQPCSPATGGSTTPIDFTGGTIAYDPYGPFTASGGVVSMPDGALYADVQVTADWTPNATGASYRNVVVDVGGTQFTLSTPTGSLQASASYLWLGGDVSLSAQHDATTGVAVNVYCAVSAYR